VLIVLLSLIKSTISVNLATCIVNKSFCSLSPSTVVEDSVAGAFADDATSISPDNAGLYPDVGAEIGGVAVVGIGIAGFKADDTEIGGAGEVVAAVVVGAGGTGAGEVVAAVVVGAGGTGAGEVVAAVVVGAGGTVAGEVVAAVVVGAGGTGAGEVVAAVVVGAGGVLPCATL
jgi:hypothetical protein